MPGYARDYLEIQTGIKKTALNYSTLLIASHHTMPGYARDYLEIQTGIKKTALSYSILLIASHHTIPEYARDYLEIQTGIKKNCTQLQHTTNCQPPYNARICKGLI